MATLLCELMAIFMRILNSDTVSKEQQKKHIAAKLFGDWKTYEDLTGDARFITGEDFVKPESVIKKLAPLKKDHPELPELTIEDITGPRGRLNGIENWTNNIQTGSASQNLNQAKSMLFDNLKITDVLDEYSAVMDYIYSEI